MNSHSRFGFKGYNPLSGLNFTMVISESELMKSDKYVPKEKFFVVDHSKKDK